MQPWFLLFPRPTNNDTYHSKRALKRLGRARSHWVYILLAITRSWLHNRESGYLSLSRLSQRAGSGKKAGCSSLCKRLADVYHRAGQNNYKLFNMSRRLVGLPNCKAKGPSGRVVFFFLASFSLFHDLRPAIVVHLPLSLSCLFFRPVVLFLENYEARPRATGKERRRKGHWPSSNNANRFDDTLVI